MSYSKLLNEVPGFDGVACNDLGIGGAHVVLTGPQPADEVWTGCMQSKQYANVTPGTYQATITLLDASMQPLTNAVMTMMTDVQKGPVTNLAINFKQSDFVKQDYVGQLDMDVQWGMADKRCNDVGVTMESVILKDKSGAVVTMPAMTDDGLKLDGTFGACFTASSTAPQRVKPLTWGHYFVTLQGKTAAARRLLPDVRGVRAAGHRAADVRAGGQRLRRQRRRRRRLPVARRRKKARRLVERRACRAACSRWWPGRPSRTSSRSRRRRARRSRLQARRKAAKPRRCSSRSARAARRFVPGRGGGAGARAVAELGEDERRGRRARASSSRARRASRASRSSSSAGRLGSRSSK